MKPDRTLDRRSAAATVRDRLNQVLSLSGLQILDTGMVAHAKKAATDSAAAQRTTRLRSFLQERGAHEEVLRHCRPELLREDHYEAVFEGIKGLTARIKRLSGLDFDGCPLVQKALGGNEPILRLNALETTTQRNEQRGTTLLSEGLVAAFRTPTAHEPRVEWALSEHDALDVLSTVSLVHRRLDSVSVHRPS